MKFDDWSQNPNVRAAAATTMSPFFHPSLCIRNATIIIYIGTQMGMFENVSHIGSVNAECQLLTSRVASWSAFSSVCQMLMLQDHFVFVTGEEHNGSVFFFHFTVEGFPEEVFKLFDAFLSE